MGVESRLRDLLEDPRYSALLRLPQVAEPPSIRDGGGAVIKNIWQSSAWWTHVVQGKGRDQKATNFGTQNNGRNIVLSLHIDGFKVFKGVSDSMTPMVCMILNLPEDLRHRQPFLILAGVHPGPKKPLNLNPYLQLLVNELKRLYEKGFAIHDPTLPGHPLVMVRVKLLCTCADYPAHQDNNCQQGASAKWGCIKCYIKVSNRHSMVLALHAFQNNALIFNAYVDFTLFAFLVLKCLALQSDRNGSNAQQFGGYASFANDERPFSRTHEGILQHAHRASA